MLFESEVRLIFLNHPIGVQITRELFGVAVLIKFAFWGLAFFPQLLEFFVADGAAGGFDESGIYSNTFVDGQSLRCELA